MEGVKTTSKWQCTLEEFLRQGDYVGGGGLPWRVELPRQLDTQGVCQDAGCGAGGNTAQAGGTTNTGWTQESGSAARGTARNTTHWGDLIGSKGTGVVCLVFQNINGL